jgi:hypothetical protein
MLNNSIYYLAVLDISPQQHSETHILPSDMQLLATHSTTDVRSSLVLD